METNDVMIPDWMNTLVKIMELSDSTARDHIRRIQYYTRILLRAIRQQEPELELTDSQIEKIVVASTLQDLGKIGVPDMVRNKMGALTPEELEIYMKHTGMGADILDTLPDSVDQELLTYCKQICLYHHERYDGSGMPHRLQGDEIPFAAQVVTVAEVYDLMTTDHFYKRRERPTVAFEEIVEGRAGAFSPLVLRCMKSVQDEMLEFAYSENARKD